jgi:hypothetical protein
MSEMQQTEIDKAIEHAGRTGETLFVGMVARRIASACGGSPQAIAEELTQAGIKAGVTMQFGSQTQTA